jgi:hypothetical protein
MAEKRATRACAKCGVEDSEAHHVQYVAFNHPVTGEGVDLSVSKHVVCCAEDGCPICSTDVAAVGSNASHKALTHFVQNRPPAEVQSLFEQFRVETPDFNIPGTQEA